MKRLGKILIFAYILATLLVAQSCPTMHKPASLESSGFKIKDEIQNPRYRTLSDLEVKVKFHRTRPYSAKKEDKTIRINPDDDKNLAFDFNKDNTKFKETVVEIDDKSNVKNRDLVVDASGNRSSLENRDVVIGDSDFKSRDVGIGFDDSRMRSRDMEIDLRGNERRRDMELGIKDQGFDGRDIHVKLGDDQDIQQTDIVLEDMDEVGHKDFKASKEEIIAWNVWRSNLQNTIMMNSAVEAPVGTLITFSFNVSKSGNITNLKYHCSNKKYAPAARADMVAVLKGLRYTNVVKFPANTKRTNVKFKGAFLLDYSTSFSKPSDYSDYERVRH